MALAVSAGAIGQPVAEADATVAEQYLLSAANQERAALGLQQLHRDPLLALAALQHAHQMAAHAAISHQFPGEPELTARASTAGVRFSVVEENVGEAPSAVKIHDLWMHSAGHRANLLDPAIDTAGISVIERNGELYAVEDFAKAVRSFSLEEQESAIAALVTQPGLTVLANSPDSTAAARQTCAMSTGYAGARKPWFVMRFTSDSLAILPAELKTRIASGRFHQAAIGACTSSTGPFTAYNLAVLLYP
jgi:hypothetical protein